MTLKATRSNRKFFLIIIIFYAFFSIVPASFIGCNNTAHGVHWYTAVSITVFGQALYKNFTNR